MKRCPNCDRTFEDTLTYCLVDGTILSAPFAERRTEELPTEVLQTSEQPTSEDSGSLRTPPQSTIAAGFQPLISAIDSQSGSGPTSRPPFIWVVITGIVAVFFLIAIVVFGALTISEHSSYFLLMLVRRSPLFLLYLAGIIFALVRMKRHPRASIMTVLSLVIFSLESTWFTLFIFWLPRVYIRMHLSTTAVEWLYAIVYFVEDFVFCFAIVLLVAAAYTDRKHLDYQAQTTS